MCKESLRLVDVAMGLDSDFYLPDGQVKLSMTIEESLSTAINCIALIFRNVCIYLMPNTLKGITKK